MVNYHLDFDFDLLVKDVVANVQRFAPPNSGRLDEKVRRSATELSRDELRAVYLKLIDAVSERVLISYILEVERS